MRKGRMGEYFAIYKLIEKGFDVYVSLVDDKGIDFVIKSPRGRYLEIQVKSVWAEGSKEWFQIQTKYDMPDLIRENYFIIGIDFYQNCWIFPSEVFFKCATKSIKKKGKGGYTFDLNLVIKRRGKDKINRELLKEYKENWKLLDGGAAI